MSNFLIEIYILVFGMCVGSFLNVCIYRLPLPELSIIRPRSKCPSCEQQIRFYDNIPLVSYLLLSGRCRTCKWPIPLRYPTVETMSGLFALAVYLKFGLTLEALITYLFIAVLIVITFIDLDHEIIPNRITLPGIPFFFIASLLVPRLSWLDALLGLAAGGGSLYLVAMLYRWLKKKEGMGGGDIKLLAMIGTMVGLKGVLFTVFISSAIGTLSGFILMLTSRILNMQLRIPYGPFLSISAILYIFWGREIILWYLQLLR